MTLKTFIIHQFKLHSYYLLEVQTTVLGKDYSSTSNIEFMGSSYILKYDTIGKNINIINKVTKLAV